MKLSKKVLVAGSFVLGVAILTTSALANMVIGSGYTGLKDSIKQTAHTFATETPESFTAEFSITLKEGDKVFNNDKNQTKIDLVNGREEQKTETYAFWNDEDGVRKSYRYNDADMRVYDYGDGEGLHLMHKAGSNDKPVYYPEMDEDIFETEEAKDVEKLIDAFVGNLDSLVQVEEIDGKTVYSGSIDSTQIPTYANALMSFIIKYSYLDSFRNRENIGADFMSKDVYVSGAHAKAIANEDGILTNCLAVGEFKGKDKNGTDHTYTIEVYYSLYDIGSTVVDVPDITNAVDDGYEAYSDDEKDMYSTLDSSDVGAYKHAIVEWEKNERKFVGTQTFEITSVDEDGNAEGILTETYKDGRLGKSFEFEIEAENSNGDLGIIEYELDGEKYHGVVSRSNDSSLWVCLDVTIEDSDYDPDEDASVAVEVTRPTEESEIIISYNSEGCQFTRVD